MSRFTVGIPGAVPEDLQESSKTSRLDVFWFWIQRRINRQLAGLEDFLPLFGPVNATSEGEGADMKLLDSITSVRLTIEQFQLDMITSHSGSVELWCQGL